ncbi:hypothetical protein FE257_005778 [Aspergillus nanangensis]|uniref:Cellobiose dehydrogenase-like cytochrome domain-containing protein n=1 Tax=Aspergillus nanangensis TaxID=2582783 RepID=A0AAD4CQK3_ASPNN|nr:hypothetical protein FE257_005778 [Aspergillus nanangensis]
MGLLSHALATMMMASTLMCRCLAQKPGHYIDPGTKIGFTTWSISGEGKPGELTFGMALPSNALQTDATEFIGYINYAGEGSSGWSGFALGGSMTDSLLLLAYPDGDDMRTSLRFTAKYSMPGVYTGNATVTEISHRVTPCGYSLIFRCADCLHWSQDGINGSASTSNGEMDIGFAHSDKSPGDPGCPRKATLQKHEQQGTWTAELDKSTTSNSYDDWRGMAKPGHPDKCS